MRRGLTRILGAVLALALALGAASISGCRQTPFGASYNGSVVVLGLGADAEGASVPAAVVVITTTNGTVARAVDPRMEVTVPGTSYARLRDAYPFAGGAGVVGALASAEGEESLPFVALSADEVVDLLGLTGVDLELASGIAAYRGGALYRLPAGAHTFAGAELGALLVAIDYVAAEDRRAVENALAEAIVRAIAEDPSALAEAVAADASATDLSPAGVTECVDALDASGETVTFSAYQ